METSSTKMPLHTLITGLPGSGKASLVKWSLRNIPPQYAVVVYDTAGEFRECDSVGRFAVNPLGLPPQRVWRSLKRASPRPTANTPT